MPAAPSPIRSCQNPAETSCLVQKTQFFLLPFPANCIYADEARGELFSWQRCILPCCVSAEKSGRKLADWLVL